MFIEKFKFGNYADLMKILNLDKNIECEYKVENETIIFGVRTNYVYSKDFQKLVNQPKTIYTFTDFEVKKHELRKSEDGNINYVNVDIDQSIIKRYTKYMSKTFGERYDKALVEHVNNLGK